MAEIQITTTQNVTIAFRAAEAGERIFAFAIDWVIKYSYLGLVIAIFSNVLKYYGTSLDQLLDADMWSAVALFILLALPVFFYTLILESLLSGQTVGKKLIKIQVVKIDGYQASLIDFFIRWSMRLVDFNIFNGMVALVCIGSTKKNQRLGDLASGTAVISFKKKFGINHTILQEIKQDYQPIFASVIKLSDNDVRIIKENYIKAKEKNDHSTMLILKEKIIKVIEQEPDSSYTAEQFISRIIGDYNYYTQNM